MMGDPSFEGIQKTAQDISFWISPTPLTESHILSAFLKSTIWLKNETFTPISSFKLRGALAEIIRNPSVKGVVTSSTGNHGLGVAYAARLIGKPSFIFLPNRANPVKRRMIQFFGGSIFERGEDLDEAKLLAIQYAKENHFLMIDDGESKGVIEGAGTIGLEIGQSLKKVDYVLVPMGSGSLASGIAIAMKSLHPNAKVIAVQSEGAPAMAQSFRMKRSVSLPCNTIADGLVCRVPAELSLRMLIAFVEDTITVSDEEILRAVRDLALEAHILTEPSGAAALAAAVQLRETIQNQVVVLVLTGSNITDQLLKEALSCKSLIRHLNTTIP
ncbi:threonine/serine dehydratase [bacterium]|nr:threonine/serine dehydratase [bacterium]